ncbi:MAG: bifunctional hydroxymethylpyrimidine kinase/phosphomethylpyrimidine kinase [Dokdonella sp.]
MSKTTSAPAVCLTIAGSDSGGGAGIQADLHTFAAFGVHGVSVVTAVTAQNTQSVSAVMTLPSRLLRAQFKAVAGDFPVAAAKIGMLGNPSVVRVVAELLAEADEFPVILDPVLVATTGAALGSNGVATAIRRYLFARSALITPNVPEAAELLGISIRSSTDFSAAAQALVDAGAKAILLKGAHLEGPVVRDLLVKDGRESWFEHPRVAVEGHGTGCTLSAAIAANLARGLDLKEAVGSAIAYVQRALAASYRPGRGPVSVLGRGLAAPQTDGSG